MSIERPPRADEEQLPSFLARVVASLGERQKAAARQLVFIFLLSFSYLGFGLCVGIAEPKLPICILWRCHSREPSSLAVASGSTTKRQIAAGWPVGAAPKSISRRVCAPFSSKGCRFHPSLLQLGGSGGNCSASHFLSSSSSNAIEFVS